MENQFKHITFILIGLLAPVVLLSQTFNQFVKNGDREFAEGDYYAASIYYGRAMELNDHRIDINYKFAEASRLFNDYKPASRVYGVVLADDNYLNFPLAEFWQAVTLKYQGAYEPALRHFKNFAGRYRQNDFYKIKALHEVESMPIAIELMKDTADAELMHMGPDINTAYSEFGAFELRDSLLLFSSIREVVKDTDGEKEFLSKIYAYFLDSNTWRQDETLMGDLNNAGPHIANGTFGPDLRTFYFTKCSNITKSELHCGIFASVYKKGTWSQPRPLRINLPCCTSTQPAVGVDANGTEVLFFASDRVGGFGKMDIWMSEKGKDGRFGEPQNLGTVVNSADDESTPFYDSESNTLFFSSKWHAGLGGYDIFRTQKTDGVWTKPENLGFPFNTSYNDLYYMIDPEENSGYLTSNRLGALYLKGETCCNDIFAFQWGKAKVDTPVTSPMDSPAITIVDTSVEIATLTTDTIRQVIGKGEIVSERAKADKIIAEMRDLLPITLYFHNDEPDCCTMSDTTNLNYQKTYEDYSSLLYQYIDAYSDGKSGAEKDSSEAEIRRLFSDYVDKGMIDLIRFSRLLNEALEIEDRELEVTIEGYCSPLAINPYNLNLAERRIASLRNYFFAYKDGVFNSYVESGQLNFIHEPIGEANAPERVSDNPEDVQNSIYNPDAARERRVFIIAIDAR